MKLLCALALAVTGCSPAPALPYTQGVHAAPPLGTVEYRDYLVNINADRWGMDNELMLAIAKVENPKADSLAVSPAGALGLMQVMPGWEGSFPECGTNLKRAATNVCYGVRIFKWYYEYACALELDCALAGYNGAVTPWKAARYIAQVNERLGTSQ